MSINYYQEWRDAGHDYHSDPVTEADVCGPEDFDDDPTDLPEPFLDTDDPWSGWIIAQLIIAFSDEMQSETAPW